MLDGTQRREFLSYERRQVVMPWVRFAFLAVMIVLILFPVVWIVFTAMNPSQSLTGSLSDEVKAATEANAQRLDDYLGDGVNLGAAIPYYAGIIGNVDDVLGYVVSSMLPEVDETGELVSNFNTLFNEPRFPFWRWFTNSILVAVITSVATVFLTALAAFSFSRFRFRGRQPLLVTILLVQVFPNLLAMVALFLILQQIGAHIPFLGLNTAGGLILVYVGGAMGINTWLMKGFFDSIPRDIDESAMVDGANHWQTFWQLIIPLVRPILIVVGILAFAGTFNEFVLARVLLRDKDSWTLMVGLWGLISDANDTQWGLFAAGAVIGSLPTLVIYLTLQDQIVGGLTQGSVKG